MPHQSNAQAHRNALEALNRYQTRPQAAGNRILDCSPEGFKRVSAETISKIRHARPPFNWPKESSNLGNAITIFQMGVDVLVESGFEREAESFKLHFMNATPAFKELPNLMHAYLDFEPAKKLEGPALEELRSMAEAAGIDPESIGHGKKKKVKNPLAHKSSSLADEWDWLVAHAGERSPFGKTAACELSARAIVELSSMWINDLGAKSSDPDDPSFGNRAWFDRRFPMGWMSIDHLHETAIVSAPLDFEERMLALAYLCASQEPRGASFEEICAISFAHSNIVDMNGAAHLANQAQKYFSERVIRCLQGNPRPPTKTEETLALAMSAANPGRSFSASEWVWQAYCVADPFAANFIVQTVLGDGESPSSNYTESERAHLLALIELSALDATGITLSPGKGEAPENRSSHPSLRL